MGPILFTLGPLTFYAWGTLAILGLAAGTTLTILEGCRRGLGFAELLDVCFSTALAGLAGARLLYVIVEWPAFRPDPVRAFIFVEGGLSIYGAFLGGAAGVWLLARRFRRSAWAYADIMAPGIALGLALGRVGCLLRGCCYGRLTDQTWGLATQLAPGLRYPAQAMEAAIDLAILAVLGAPAFRPRARPHPAGPREGLRFLAFLGLYAAGRFIVEFYRDSEVLIGWMTTSQAFSLAVLALVVWLAGRGRVGRRRRVGL
ncbi:MAG TPA: prolipoprotein diacylglyceryl transferase [Bacillota bacterium]|jgi:phosphatidylglycerol:prolipoprotein diacylglycerol transferase